jgi:para-aminobenzoate synthetase component 1
VATVVRSKAVHEVLDCAPSAPLDRVIGSWPEPALLESGPGFGSAGRFSILTAHPRLVFEARSSRWWLRHDSEPPKTRRGTPLLILSELLNRFALGCGNDRSDRFHPPFQGGMIGFFGYDLAPQLERLPRRALRDSRLPDIRMALYDTAVIIDAESNRVDLWSWDLTGEGRLAAERRATSWRKAITKALRSPFRSPIRISELGPATSPFDRETYGKSLRRVLDYIAAGDVFQVNLSHRFTAYGRPRPLDLYLRLKAKSPAPFAAFLRWGDLAVISASPESFCQTRGDSIVTRPIKGTRPRHVDPVQDEWLAQELAASLKDRAELTMIIDLERNDLGRVCRYGSVRVREPHSVESFAQVHHLVATIEGRLRRGTTPIDLVCGLFPGGSITGAPKIRAMQIIDELEPNRRSLYTGAIGYLSRGGSSEFNIAIRTMLVEGNRVSFQVGGGIVADSDADAEYEETLAKGKALLEVLNPRTYKGDEEKR